MADVLEVLTQEGDSIVDSAATALERSGLRHYAEAGPDAARDRLGEMYALVVASVSTHDLVPMIDHSDRVAHERFEAGFDISEVQTALNVLEVAIWAKVKHCSEAESDQPRATPLPCLRWLSRLVRR